MRRHYDSIRSYEFDYSFTHKQLSYISAFLKTSHIQLADQISLLCNTKTRQTQSCIWTLQSHIYVHIYFRKYFQIEAVMKRERLLMYCIVSTVNSV